MNLESQTPAGHKAGKKTLVVLQPGYLPWLGFFDQLRRSSVFVYYDDVQYDKHGWRNRNRIKSPDGPLWLTVPVRHKGLDQPAIRDIEIDPSRPWAKKHLASIEQLYRHAPHVQKYLPELREILSRPWTKLIDLDLALVETLSGWLGIRREIHLASSLGIPGGKTQRLVDLCRHFSVEAYLTGDAARDYLEVAEFEKAGIQVEWHDYRHPVYRQLHGDFVPYLSVIDLILNEGERSLPIIISGQKAEES